MLGVHLCIREGWVCMGSCNSAAAKCIGLGLALDNPQSLKSA